MTNFPLPGGGKRVVIGVGEMAVSDDRHAILSTYGLGSCVAVVAYDPMARIGGLLHLMLPDSAIAVAKSRTQPTLFVDTGLPCFIQALVDLHADRGRLRFFLGGGASVLTPGPAYRIGARNLQATMCWLLDHGFSIGDAGTGGTINRALHLEIATGAMTLRTPHSHEKFSFQSVNALAATAGAGLN